ncbi:MAG: hypothetical protein IH940_08175 [Acidobacteria bacterium]|nr:hypothetical protein [Acidobacteriota bacterium]
MDARQHERTVDDLEDRSGVDLRQDNIRGFVDGSLTDPGSGAIVFPGRDHGDSVAVTSAVGVAFGNDLLLCAEAVPVGPPGPGTVRLELLDGDAVVLSVESTLDQDSGWTVGVAGPNGSLAAMNLERSKLKVGKFGLIIDSDTARLVAVIGGEEHSTTVDDGVDVPAGVLTPRLVFENRGNGRAMWELVRFVASSDVSSPMW